MNRKQDAETSDIQTTADHASTGSPFHYVHSVEFPAILDRIASTLVVTTYQAGKLAVFRTRQGRLSLLPRTFEHAMGVAASAEWMAIGTAYQVWMLRNDAELASAIKSQIPHDACYLPRRSHVTGNVQIHELAWGRSAEELWIVNTRFNCLCTLDHTHSFVPQWTPPFISRVVPQDRCHLNGLAMVNGQPRFVTAFAESDEPEGWRTFKTNSGCVIDVENGETIASGLSMPHSPRWYNERLWLLDSGTGRVVCVDPSNGQVDAVIALPGYTRGLAFHGRYAFVGLSRIRESSTFDNVPIAENRDALKCGVWVVDIVERSVVAFLEFEKDVTEIFDVQLLSGIRYPAIIGLEKDTVEGAFVLPKGSAL
jgi:uncharacterized protein (TIGR03032 family)